MFPMDLVERLIGTVDACPWGTLSGRSRNTAGAPEPVHADPVAELLHAAATRLRRFGASHDTGLRLPH